MNALDFHQPHPHARSLEEAQGLIAAQWTPSVQFADTIAQQPALQDDIPSVRYHLIDLGEYTDEHPLGDTQKCCALEPSAGHRHASADALQP